MAPDVLRDELRKTHFEPFRLIQSDGKNFDVFHPDGVIVGNTFAVISIYSQQQRFPDRYTTLDLKHIIRTEPIAAPAPNENPF